MPFNLLLLPLLAGYLYLTKSNLRSYATSQIPKEHLLLHAALTGLFFLVVSRTICLLLLSFPLGHEAAKALHRAAPFPYVGTAFGTVLLSLFFIKFSNAFISEKVAGVWLYHSGQVDPMTRALWRSTIGIPPTLFARRSFSLTANMIVAFSREMLRLLGWKIFTRSLSTLYRTILLIRNEHGLALAGLHMGQAAAIMVWFKDNKVLVGYLTDLPANKPIAEFITIAPIWTGFRDSTTNKVYKTVDYGEAMRSAEDPMALSRVFRTADISSVSLFNATAFNFDRLPELRAEKTTARQLRAGPKPHWRLVSSQRFG